MLVVACPVVLVLAPRGLALVVVTFVVVVGVLVEVDALVVLGVLDAVEVAVIVVVSVVVVGEVVDDVVGGGAECDAADELDVEWVDPPPLTA